jgi:hypothetical protein
MLYLVEGVWMLVFSPARPSILLEMAFLTSILAYLTYSMAKRHFGWIAAAFSGVLLICLPIVQVYSDEIMAESLLAIVSFAAAIYFARYLESFRWQDSALFGVFASLAILTKGNGWELALVPPLALMLTRDFRAVRERSFWLPALIVLILCLPWQVETLSYAQRGWQGGDHPNISFTLQAVPQFLKILIDLLGWGLAPLLFIGVSIAVLIPFVQEKVEAEWATWAALIMSAVIFHSVVPAGIESRKLFTAVPALVLFLFAGGVWLVRKFSWNPALVMAVAIAVFGIQKFSIPVETHYGYSEAARFLHDQINLKGRNVILVSSERDGEGMLVSELAMIEKRPTHQILRATKVLAATDWNGTVFRSYYKTPDEMLSYLRREGVGILVSDTLPGATRFDFQRVINETIANYPGALKLIATFHGDVKGGINIYTVN